MNFDDYGFYNDYGDFSDYYGSYDYDNSRNYNFDSFSNNFDKALMTVLLIFMVISLVILVVKLGLYILKGFALYTIARRLGKESPWLGFVPFARYYLQGELSGDIKLKKGEIRDAGIWLIALPIVRGVIFGVLSVMLWTVIGVLSSILIAGGAGGSGALLAMMVFFVLYFLVAIMYQAVYRGLRMLVDYQIYERFTSRNMAILHGGFSAIVPMYESICLFVMRKRPFNEGMEPEMPEAPTVPEEPQEVSYNITDAQQPLQEPTPETAETTLEPVSEPESKMPEAVSKPASEPGSKMPEAVSEPESKMPEAVSEPESKTPEAGSEPVSEPTLEATEATVKSTSGSVQESGEESDAQEQEKKNSYDYE